MFLSSLEFLNAGLSTVTLAIRNEHIFLTMHQNVEFRTKSFKRKSTCGSMELSHCWTELALPLEDYYTDQRLTIKGRDVPSTSNDAMNAKVMPAVGASAAA